VAPVALLEAVDALPASLFPPPQATSQAPVKPASPTAPARRRRRRFSRTVPDAREVISRTVFPLHWGRAPRPLRCPAHSSAHAYPLLRGGHREPAHFLANRRHAPPVAVIDRVLHRAECRPPGEALLGQMRTQLVRLVSEHRPGLEELEGAIHARGRCRVAAD